eukprot:EG_transcript_28721
MPDVARCVLGLVLLLAGPPSAAPTAPRSAAWQALPSRCPSAAALGGPFEADDALRCQTRCLAHPQCSAIAVGPRWCLLLPSPLGVPCQGTDMYRLAHLSGRPPGQPPPEALHPPPPTLNLLLGGPPAFFPAPGTLHGPPAGPASPPDGARTADFQRPPSATSKDEASGDRGAAKFIILEDSAAVPSSSISSTPGSPFVAEASGQPASPSPSPSAAGSPE